MHQKHLDSSEEKKKLNCEIMNSSYNFLNSSSLRKYRLGLNCRQSRQQIDLSGLMKKADR